MERLKRLSLALFAWAQKILLPPCLALAYLFGVGLTALLYRAGRAGPPRWEPSGPDFSPEEAGSQS